VPPRSARPQPRLEGIWRKYPKLRPAGRRLRGQNGASRSAGDGGKALSRDNALCAQQQLMDATGFLDRSIVTVMHELGPEELREYKILIGTAMAESSMR
jgi:hypothetical protein